MAYYLKITLILSQNTLKLIFLKLPILTHFYLQVFVELYDLKLIDEKNLNGCWEETARWVKYEEDVEGVDHRWGQPHVAFLSMSSMFQLRKCISKGNILHQSIYS